MKIDLDDLEARARAWRQDGDPRFIGANVVLALIKTVRERDAALAATDDPVTTPNAGTRRPRKVEVDDD